MKKLFYLTLILAAMVSCSSDPEQTVEKSLTGTLWSTFYYHSQVNGSDVYLMLRFISNDQLEYYAATEKSQLTGIKDTLTYVYTHPSLLVNFTGTNLDGQVHTGEVGDTYIQLLTYTFSKEN